MDERPPQELKDELERLESDYEIFKINLFKEFTKYIIVNSAIAVVLAVILVVIAFKAEDPITEAWEPITVLLVFMSLGPAPLTLGVLSWDANRQLKPMTARAHGLEAAAARAAGTIR
ncbi:hypothetical protein [Bradyrhizobium sp. CCBAU 65884]|uniref:hypothetical protein n=1 Tax=Bradyrhizobium sp. CCBAU 65884 TaxID=722477 RepID=UPI002306D16E|nr:hypothetical protein [Bradyrhizobium sp. CCBAU 65884]